MKKIKTIVCLMLSMVLGLSVFGCSCSGNPPPVGGHVNEVTDTDIDLVKGGKSDYSVLIPDDADAMIEYAAQEMVNFVAQAASCTLPIVRDANISFSASSKFLSIGSTKALKASGVSIDMNELNLDGFKLVSKDNSIILAGGSNEGTMYAVYDFLKYNFGYEFYAPTEIAYKTNDNVKLKKYNVIEVPDFQDRTTYYSSLLNSKDGRQRMRSGNNSRWGLFAHTFFKLINPDVYQEAHPDWFDTADGTPKQLCLTRDDGMRIELVKNLKQIILSKPDSTYFSIGQEDNMGWCSCDSCKASEAKYGGKTATLMRFVNAVARDIKQFVKDEEITRPIYISTFAYQTTSTPPIKIVKDVMEPFDPSVVAEDNVIVQFAPLAACFSHSIMDECNASFRNDINGWKTITKNFSVWTYSTNFTNYLINFNNFSGIQVDYQVFKDIGTKVLMDQGAGNSVGTPFHELRAYIHSKLMWKVDQNVNNLIDDFMKNYYKEAYPELKEYYNLIRMHYSAIEEDYAAKNGKVFCTYVYNIYPPSVEESQYWPMTFLDKCSTLFNTALERIEKMPNGKTKELLHTRVLSETLSIRYFYLSFHYRNFTSAQRQQMVDSFEEDAAYVGLTDWKENTSLSEKITEWRKII